MLRVAITGGLCSGKSTVATMFCDLGWPVLDADAMGHELLRQGAKSWAEVVAAFSPDILDEAGDISRPKLAAVVFAPGAEAKLRQLNAILHPRIEAATEHRFAAWEREGRKIGAAEAALFIEAGMVQRFNRVILVTCATEERLRRFEARTGGTRGQGLARMAAQWTDEEKAKFATDRIDNSGALPETRQQVETIYRQVQDSCDSDKA